MDYLVSMKCPFVEIGAGKGYLAHELRNRHCTVYAYDIIEEKEMWTDVKRGGPKKIEDHPDSTLILCYPPQSGHYGAKMSEKCVKLYSGQDIIYIGEDLDEVDIASTGTVEFAIALRKAGFEIVKQLSCVQFPHIFDKMFHYKKK